MTNENKDSLGAAKSGWQKPLPAKLPRPTAAPAIVAFGATFMAWGIVTSWIISGVGLVLFSIGIASWIGEMRLDHQRSEQDPAC